MRRRNFLASLVAAPAIAKLPPAPAPAALGYFFEDDSGAQVGLRIPAYFYPSSFAGAIVLQNAAHAGSDLSEFLPARGSR